MNDTTHELESSTFLKRVSLVLTVLAVATLVVGTIGPPLFGEGTLLAADQSTLGDPWGAYHEPGVLNIGDHGPVTDTIDAVYPVRVAVTDAAADLRFFGWNPYVSGGAPAAAESSNGSLSPFVVFYLVAPRWFAPALIKLATMVVAIAFTFLFCRRLGLQRVPALFAGAAFAGSGFLLMWTSWQQPEVAALIAALFWATERYLQGPSVARATPVALVVAAMLLAGFPAVTGFALYGLAAYVVLRLWRGASGSVRTRLVTGVGAGVGVVVGVLLVAAVVIPFGLRLAYLDTSSRAQTGASSQGLAPLITLVAPKALGLSTDGGYFGSRNQVEVVSFVGMTTVLLGIVALCLPRPRTTPSGARAGLATIAVGFGALAFGGGAPLAVAQQLPVFTDNFVGRASSIIGFAAAVLAAIGLQGLIERRPLVGMRARVRAGTVAAVAAVLAATAAWKAYDVAREVDRVDTMGGDVVVPIAVGLAALVLLPLVRSRRPALSAGASVGLVGLLVIESLTLALPLLPNEDEELLFPGTPGIGYLTENIGHDRVAPERLNLFHGATALFGLRSATGHVFTAPTWKQALREADAKAFAHSPTGSQLRAEPEVVTSPMLDRLGVRWFAASAWHQPIGRLEEGGLAGASCERPALLGQQAVALPVDDGLRGVRIRVCGTVDLPQAAAIGVTAEAGGTAVGSMVPLPPTLGAIDLSVGIPGDELTGSGDIRVTFTLENGDGRVIPVATNGFGTVAVEPIRPIADGLRMAYAGDMRIYERTEALPRIRWAGNAVVEEDPARRLELLGSGDVPGDTTVLSQPGPLGAGEQADVEVTVDAPTAISAQVDAAGDGYLVVADALQVDWQATVDGRAVDMVDAEHAAVAVPVPRGVHTVAIAYRPRGQRAGMVISAVTALGVALALIGPPAVRRARRRTGSAVPDATGSDQPDSRPSEPGTAPPEAVTTDV